MIKAKLKGHKLILKKLETRLKRTQNKHESIFGFPLNKIVSEFKKELSKGSLGPRPFNRIYTTNLYKNTKYELHFTPKNRFDYSLSIKLGYFVDYGLDLEIGSNPKLVPLERIRDWLIRKSIDPTGRAAYPVQQKILRQGANAYPIIRPVWNARKNKYISEVFSRIMKQWR